MSDSAFCLSVVARHGRLYALLLPASSGLVEETCFSIPPVPHACSLSSHLAWSSPNTARSHNPHDFTNPDQKFEETNVVVNIVLRSHVLNRCVEGAMLYSCHCTTVDAGQLFGTQRRELSLGKGLGKSLRLQLQAHGCPAVDQRHLP